MPPRNILVPVDGSPHSLDAVRYADDLAEVCGARLTLVHAMKEGGAYQITQELKDLARVEHIEISENDVMRARAESVIDEARSCVSKCPADRVSTDIRPGDATDEIVACVREKGIDLVVMGSRGLGDFQGLLLGSVSHKVIQLADCPCLVVRG